MKKLSGGGIVILAALSACNAGSQEPARTGAELYANHCASCHGEIGEGDGPVAEVMRVTMPNLRTLSMRNNGEFPAEDVRAYIDGRSIPAAHGDRYMPIWGVVFGWGTEDPDESEERIEQRIDGIVEHVRMLQYR